MKAFRLTLTYVVMAVITILFTAPILYMLVGSLKPNDEVLNGLSGFLPVHLSLDNYRGVLHNFSNEDTGYFRDFYLTSIIVTAVTVLGGLVVNSLAGYALARLRWAGRNWVLLGVISLVVLPFESIVIPLFYLLRGHRDTYWTLCVPFVAYAFSIYLFYNFFVQMPKELEEAARVDGAGPWRTFFSVIVPSAKPAFAAAAILTFLFSWGQFLWPVLMVTTAKHRTLPQEISVFLGQSQQQWGDIFAFGVLMVLPVLVVFLTLQRWFVQSVASSGIKG